MRIGENMAMSGSITRNQDAQNDNDNTPAMRPGSPITLDEDTQAALTDVEDMEEHQQLILPNQPFAHSLTVPGAIPNNDLTDMDVLTDTELVMTEGEDEEPEEEDPAPREQVLKLVQDYQDEQAGEVSVEDNMGEKMLVSHASRTNLPLPSKEEEESSTDVEDVEGDDEFEVDIVDMDLPGAGPYFIEFPILDDGNDVVTVSMLEKPPIIEEGGEEEGLTDVEDLETVGQNFLSAANQLFIQNSPNLSGRSSPLTDEEVLEGMSSRPSFLNAPDQNRSITPSDVGEERLYDDITDEEDFGLEGQEALSPPPKNSIVPMSLLVQEENDGFMTDYEDLQDSGDESDPETSQKSKEMEEASAEAAERIFQATSSAASSETIYKEQSFDNELEENTDDEEINIQNVDSRKMTPRLVLYQAKNTLLVETDDEGNDGGVTDTEELFVADAETPSASGPAVGFDRAGLLYTAEEERMIEEIMESMHGSVETKETERDIEAPPSKSDHFLLAEVEDSGPLTDVEDLEESGSPVLPAKPSALSLRAPMEGMEETGTVKIIISPSPGSPDVNGGGIAAGIAKRRAKKKHRKNTRGSVGGPSATFPQEEREASASPDISTGQ